MGDRISKVCLDASVIIKLLISEKNTETAKHTLEYLLKSRVSIIEPHYAKIEVLSTIRKKVALRSLTKNNAKKVIKLFESFIFSYNFETRKLLNLAYSISEKTNSTVIYDCIYLALAKQKNAVFITADEQSLSPAKKVYPSSYSIEEFQKLINRI